MSRDLLSSILVAVGMALIVVCILVDDKGPLVVLGIASGICLAAFSDDVAKLMLSTTKEEKK